MTVYSNIDIVNCLEIMDRKPMSRDDDRGHAWCLAKASRVHRVRCLCHRNYNTTGQTNLIANENGKGPEEVKMRSLTLAILAIATLSMTRSTTAQTYGPEYRCNLTASGRPAHCAVNPDSAARWRYVDGGRHYFANRSYHYNLGPSCTFYSMWSWPFTC
jgi:hypothetical protein